MRRVGAILAGTALVVGAGIGSTRCEAIKNVPAALLHHGDAPSGIGNVIIKAAGCDLLAEDYVDRSGIPGYTSVALVVPSTDRMHGETTGATIRSPGLEGALKQFVLLENVGFISIRDDADGTGMIDIIVQGGQDPATLQSVANAIHTSQLIDAIAPCEVPAQ